MQTETVVKFEEPQELELATFVSNLAEHVGVHPEALKAFNPLIHKQFVNGEQLTRVVVATSLVMNHMTHNWKKTCKVLDGMAERQSSDAVIKNPKVFKERVYEGLQLNITRLAEFIQMLLTSLKKTEGTMIRWPDVCKHIADLEEQLDTQQALHDLKADRDNLRAWISHIIDDIGPSDASTTLEMAIANACAAALDGKLAPEK
jgi:hypothetical protein